MPSLGSLLLAPLLALLLAGLALTLLQGLWTWLVPTYELPLAALAILAIGLAPWCLRQGHVLHGMVVFALLLGAYLIWHQAAAWILDYPHAEAPLPLTWLAVLLFLGLYVLQAVILARPKGVLAQRLYPLAFAGFYLDEHFTRLTFRLWPVRPLRVSTFATGDRT